jgi:hypothetical protein
MYLAFVIIGFANEYINSWTLGVRYHDLRYRYEFTISTYNSIAALESKQTAAADGDDVTRNVPSRRAECFLAEMSCRCRSDQSSCILRELWLTYLLGDS